LEQVAAAAMVALEVNTVAVVQAELFFILKQSLLLLVIQQLLEGEGLLKHLQQLQEAQLETELLQL
jgi:hypothetical protein